MSSSPHFGLRSPAATDLLAAVAAVDWDRADSVLPHLHGDQGDDVWHAAAEVHTIKLRWNDAAGALGRIAAPDIAVRSRLTLSRNLAQLAIHRPLTYRMVIDAGPADMYRIHEFEDGEKTVVYQPKDAPPIFLSRNPAATVATAMMQLRPRCEKGEALALLSIGDGHVLAALSKNPPKLFLDREQTIFLFEPDPRLLLVCLLIHDFTGPGGPIEQQRVRWYVGERWAAAYRVDAVTDRFLPFPQTNVKLGVTPQPIEAALSEIFADLLRADTAAQVDAQHYYQALMADDFRAAIAGELSRPPRVLLLTTRLSTVLQFSTRDAADAFRRLGWEAHVCIEPTPHHAMTPSAMRRTLADFKPDLIFQIDHHRFEHGELFPANIPFVNWIQDLLPHLMTRDTGAKINDRDFVLTPSLQRWADDFAYPARQCMEFRKLTRVPPRPVSWHAGEQLIYVSNWSQKPAQMRDELLAETTGVMRDLMSAACERMIQIYSADGTLHTPGDVRRMLGALMADLQVSGEESAVRKMTSRLCDRMNNLLYRQQGLTWAMRAGRDLGLKLQIYGSGWDANPKFAECAAGPVKYGEPLENLTRAAGVNLVLEPFVCVAHQRLLDALSAGGFCLIRSTPWNAILRSLVDIVGPADASMNSTVAFRSALQSPDEKDSFERTLSACAALEPDAGFDHIANTRRLIDAGFLPSAGGLLPQLDNVLFDNVTQLREALVRFTRDDALRGEIAKQQRKAVEGRYSYAAGMARVIQFVVGRLAVERAALAKAA